MDKDYYIIIAYKGDKHEIIVPYHTRSAGGLYCEDCKIIDYHEAIKYLKDHLKLSYDRFTICKVVQTIKINIT